MTARAPNPFVPGRGQLPPYLAGREKEKDALTELLAYLTAGRGAPRDAALIGPRGNGKTTLMRWFQLEVQASHRRMDHLWLTPSELPDLDALATSLVPPRRFAGLRPRSLSFSVGIGRLGWELGGRPDALGPLLKARCARRPLVLLLDEAHTLDPDLGRILLNVSQTVSAEAPFLLTLAGTPDLPERLNAMSATFWGRSERLGIGRLDDTAAAAALTRPLSGLEPPIALEDCVLDRAVVDSQGYPYFVQLWGAELWKAATRAGVESIDTDIAARAVEAFSVKQSSFYQDRYVELERRDLLSVAERVAVAFNERETLTGREFDAAVAATRAANRTGGPVRHIRDDLSELGYVWKPPEGDNLWHPGIPSLMDYVKAHAHQKPRHSGRAMDTLL